MSLELGEEQVKGWLADVEALLIAPEVVKEVDVKITLQTLRSYEKRESSTEKKDVVLRAIRKDGRKVVDVPKYNFEWLNGDEEQADTAKLKSNNGIHALKELRGEELFGTVRLDKTERSKVARLASKL